MSRKSWIVLIIASLLVTAAIPVANAGSDNGKGYADIKPYNGLFGADSPFYGVKLFVQHIEVSLEGNVTLKLQKQQDLAWQRLSEFLKVVEDRNDTAAQKAALDAFIEESKLSSKILDSDLINDTAFLEAWNEYEDMEGFLAAIANNSSYYSGIITDRVNQTLNATQEIKDGRPFIYCNNTTYFIPPGQMKKIANNGTFNTPAGLGKKGYVAPEPLYVGGTVVWPWDDAYGLYTNQSYLNATNTSVAYLNQVTKHGNGNGKGNGNENANGNGNGHGKK